MAKKTKKPKKAKKHADTIRNLWTRDATPLGFGRDRFRFTLYRKVRKLPPLNIDDLVETANWERSGNLRTGELNFHRPLTERAANLMAHGDEVRCDVALWEGGSYKPVWRMKVDTPSEQIQAGTIGLALTSSLDTASKSKATFRYVTSHRHPHGWNAREVTLAVCRRFHLPIGNLPAAHYRFKKLIEKSRSPIDVVNRAWTLERTHTGRRFDVTTARGLVDVNELREPKYMLLLGEAIITDGTLDLSSGGVFSAVIVTNTLKRKGKRKAKHLRVKVVDAKRQARYGYIVKTIKAPKGHDTTAALRQYGKKWLARQAKPKKKIDFQMPGIPWLDRGDAARLYLPSVDMHQIIFLTAVRHDLSAGSYTVNVTVGFSDPWAADVRKAKTTRKKEAAAARRRRARRGSHRAPKPKKSRKRGVAA